MLTIACRRIDRVKLIRTFPTQSEMGVFNGALYGVNVQADNKELKKQNNLKAHTTEFIRFGKGKQGGTDFRFRFLSVKKSAAIAIDFTPSMFGNDMWAEFIGAMDVLFEFGAAYVWENFRVSSLEIAYDVKAKFQGVVCIAPGVTTINSNDLDKGTLYLGNEYAHRSYCIYDKRKQLFEKKKVDLPEERTRIEVTLRSLGMTLGQIVVLDRPFGNLLAVRRELLEKLAKKYSGDVAVLNFIESIFAGKIAQEAYLELNSGGRKRVAQVLRQHAFTLHSDGDVWKKWIVSQCNQLQTRFYGATDKCN